ncbi:hypothetical protein DVH24_032599 [Malus domestica]|uniref:Uncharacterized protein n=1 Tax=Malus domestica TaxID=3750 RepID=A0A498J8P7_MALDO|nr:hypothetical protein DVH24_032599 [Malus domestica]
MGATAVATKPHAVCIPLPAQGHIKAMLKFAKLLHHRGFHVTFVNSKYNHRRFLKSSGPSSLDGLPDFQFKAIPDGLPDSDADTTQDVPLLCDSIRKQNFLAPFRELLMKLNGDAISTSTNPPVTCIVSDGFMSPFTITAAEEIEVPMVLFYTIAACSFMGCIQFRALVEKGLAPLKVATKPHAVCIPAPAQGHIKAMLKFAKLLHHRGFHITFVNTEYNHKRFLKSMGPNSLDGSPDFQFAAIPDGLPDSDEDATQDVPLLCDSIRKQKLLAPFRELLMNLNSDAISTSINPPVTCIVSDGLMSPFTITAAEEIEVPIVLFYTIAACSFMGVIQFRVLIEKGLAPLKRQSSLTNGYPEKVIDLLKPVCMDGLYV